MNSFKVAILGCGTVGGGVAQILLEKRRDLAFRAGVRIELAKIVDLFPSASSTRHGIPLNYYCGGGEDLTQDKATHHIRAILNDPSIDLVVETIGGDNRHMLDLATDILKGGKHLVTANKALLARHGSALFQVAGQNGRAVGLEASVCGAIPIIRAVNECFAGDEILSVSGIMNGTSNYILSKMETEQQTFADALSGAQREGYAEADPSLDINGGDAGHKLAILLRLMFGLVVDCEDLDVKGIEQITADDWAFAQEMDCSIKLICHARREADDIFATVRPMMVKRDNFLSKIGGATNAILVTNKYSQSNVLIGQGAGSLETGSAIVADIVFVARYGDKAVRELQTSSYNLRSFDQLAFPYNISFETADIPGVTGMVATAIGKQNINIDTVSHNRHGSQNALFSIVTMPCQYSQIADAIADIQTNNPGSLLAEPKTTPILA